MSHESIIPANLINGRIFGFLTVSGLTFSVTTSPIFEVKSLIPFENDYGTFIQILCKVDIPICDVQLADIVVGYFLKVIKFHLWVTLSLH